jgi:hypothetical protein
VAALEPAGVGAAAGQTTTGAEPMSELDQKWLSRNILGRETIEALIARGIVEPPSGERRSPFEVEIHSHEFTEQGRVALRDQETVSSLSDLHDLTDHEGEKRLYSPSRAEFVQLVDVVRELYIEVISLRGKVDQEPSP